MSQFVKLNPIVNMVGKTQNTNSGANAGRIYKIMHVCFFNAFI